MITRDDIKTHVDYALQIRTCSIRMEMSSSLEREYSCINHENYMKSAIMRRVYSGIDIELRKIIQAVVAGANESHQCMRDRMLREAVNLCEELLNKIQ